MIRLSAREFWPRYRDAVRSQGNLKLLSSTRDWTRVAIDAAKSVCMDAGLTTGNEFYLDVMGYEQRVSGIFYDWDLRIAFEHENGRDWHDELCKLCHVVADLRVLVGYFMMRERIDEILRQRIGQMGDRITRVTGSEWLFIFGPNDSRLDHTPWKAYTIDDGNGLIQLRDDDPFNPFEEFLRRG
jgi:hypothetical protein